LAPRAKRQHPPRFRHGPYGTETNIHIKHADSKALTAFWRGLMIGALVAGFVAWVAA
jgi:hypothetical protein